MNRSERQKLEEEFFWLHEDPRRVVELLTVDEEKAILKAGFVPAPVWVALKPRIEGGAR